MSLRDVARLCQLGLDLYERAQGENDYSRNDGEKYSKGINPRGRLLREGLPFALDKLVGPGAGQLARVGLQVLEQRSADNAIEGEYTVVEDPSASGCRACGAEYSPSGEDRLVRHIGRLPSGLVYVLGRRGTGKSTISFRLTERWGRETYTLGVPPQSLPPGYQALKDVRDLPERSALLIDDAGLVLDSQDYGSSINRLMKHLVMVVRHLEVLVVVNTQYSSAVNKYLLDADAMFLKPPPRLYQEIERDWVARLHEKLEPFWSRLGSQTQQQKHAWAVSDVYTGPVHFQPPSFWSDAMSKNKAGVG